ncbi:hypothetical protein GTW25_09565 [Aliihoeflea aestuarii]|jgi:hypothetical protein|uniref:hypothetical protein n=1 Tax=Aliihoeflea aestuarii TaxID=453840 RepID=UPI0020937E15|nr:hypothetical protein [Aliihoeflea aestuarii]MCO6391274.1 hypothetical protein [Aliihoeflea aestuarii]
MSQDDNDKRESRRIINRVGQETEATMAQRVRDHMEGRDADQNDWAEVWGTRIGRAMGVVILLILLWSLFSIITGG